MEFQLLGKQVEICEGRRNYMCVLLHFKQMARQAAQDFKSQYDSTLGSVFWPGSYVDKYQNTYGSKSYMDGIVKQYVVKTRQFLSHYGVYSLSDATIWNDAILANGRGVSRLQFELNRFEDMLLGGPELDDATFASKLKGKFSGSSLTNCLYNDIMSLCDYVLAYLDQHNIVPIRFVYQKEADEAETIYKNLVDCSVPDEDKAQLAFSLVQLDPTDGAYYTYIFEQLPQAKYEIVAIARYLQIDMSALIEAHICKEFDVKAVQTEEQALEMQKALNEMMGQFGVTDSGKVAELNQLLTEFDIQARTFDGVLYDTRQKRAKAEEDDKEICGMYQNGGHLAKADYIALVSKLAEECYTQAVKEKHISAINSKIQEIEEADLEELLGSLSTASEEECAAIKEKVDAYSAVIVKKDSYIRRIEVRVEEIWKLELAAIIQGVEQMTEAQCNGAKEKISSHGASDPIKEPFVEPVEKRIYAIWDGEDFERFAQLLKQTPVGDPAQIAAACATVQQTGRTETKELFIKALGLLNENEVTTVAKYVMAKESGAIASFFNMGKKESYHILTLDGRVMHPAIEETVRTLKEAKGSGFFGGLGKQLKSSFAGGKPAAKSSRYCTNCGKPVDPTAAFCSSCGHKLT